MPIEGSLLSKYGKMRKYVRRGEEVEDTLECRVQKGVNSVQEEHDDEPAGCMADFKSFLRNSDIKH